MKIVRTITLGIPVDFIAASDVPFLFDMFRGRPGPLLATFVNPCSVTVARRNARYLELLGEFDVVLPDGIGLCWAVRMLHGLPAARVSFDTTSLAPTVFQRAQQDRLPVALVGGRPGVAERCADQLRRAFPELLIVGVSDGYGDDRQKIRPLKRSAPALVICGMGAGAQEQFLVRLAEAGWSGIGFTCGGYFDQLVDGLHYYPKWIDANNLRWAYRLVKEPRRLARRYLVDYTLFAKYFAWALLRQATGCMMVGAWGFLMAAC